MKIIGIMASPRKGKYTEFALNKVLDAAKQSNENVETEIINLAQKKVGPCVSCGHCRDNFSCSIKDDDFNEIIERFKSSDVSAIVMASPVYMGGMTAQAKAFLDRSVVFRRNGAFFKNKFGAAVAVGGSRNGGQEYVMQNIHAGFLIHDMIIVGDGFATSHFGGAGWERTPDGIENDEVSNATFENLGKRIAELIS